MSLSIEFCGERLQLLPEKAAYLTDHQTLLVSDLHLGKERTFRTHGLPIPSGASADTLSGLSELIARVQPVRLAILGDLFHGPASEHAEEHVLFQEWLTGLHAVETTIVLGNHDRWSRDRIPLDPCHEARIGGLALVHDPDACDDPSIGGHIHPGVLVRGPGRMARRVSCFWVRERSLVLPAFGRFTGLAPIDPAPGDRVFAATGKEVLEIPVAALSRS